MDRAEQYQNFRENTLQPSHRGHRGGEGACEAAFEYYMANRTVGWGCRDLTQPREEKER